MVTERGKPGAGGGTGGHGQALSPRCRRRQAAEPLSSHAPMLFHSLLVLLGESVGSLGSGYEDFMLKHNLRKAHRDLQVRFGAGGAGRGGRVSTPR